MSIFKGEGKLQPLKKDEKPWTETERMLEDCVLLETKKKKKFKKENVFNNIKCNGEVKSENFLQY